jgi:membrane associated rhomboid family serine protease
MFIALPVGMNYRTERLPLVTLSLIGLNTLVYLVGLLFFFSTGGDSDKWISQHLWLIPKQSFWWMYLTSMFVHAGILHLLGNMIFLFLFGSCVEDLIGRVRFTIFYLVGGLVAEFFYIGMLPEHFASVIPMGGASGAISACMGMYLLLRADVEIEFKYFLWLFFVFVRAGEFETPAWVAITFWFLKDLVFAVINMMSGQSGGGVAFGAHVGGLLSGVALIGINKWLIRLQEAKESKADESTSHPANISPSLAAAINLTRQAAQATPAPCETPAIFLYDGAAQTGPFTLTQVQTKLARGEITRDAQYWCEGMTAWQNVLELSSQPVE